MSNYKILHTSDWHIGKKIENFSILKEQKNFLYFLLEFIKKENIDLLLVAGDVYDSKRPGFEEQRLVNNFFMNFLLLLVNGVWLFLEIMTKRII